MIVCSVSPLWAVDSQVRAKGSKHKLLNNRHVRIAINKLAHIRHLGTKFAVSDPALETSPIFECTLKAHALLLKLTALLFVVHLLAHHEVV